MLIIDRYITREIAKPFLAISAVLLAIFLSYVAAQFLADAASGLLPGRLILYLIFLKLIVTLEVILPTTLYLSVVLALGRLYTDAEMTALFACGIGLRRVIKVVFVLSLFIATIVAYLSLYGRPWAFGTLYRLRDQAEREFDLAKMESGTFYQIPAERRIFFAENVDRDRNLALRVFVESETTEKVQVITAKEMYQRDDAATGGKVLVFEDGYLYEFSKGGEGGSITHFHTSTLSLAENEAPAAGHRGRASPNELLASSTNPFDVSEWQWRLSAPLSTVLLALLAVPLSRAAPRQGKYAKIVTSIVAYALYYNLTAVAKAWVHTRVVGRFPGIWWVPTLLAGVVLTLLWRHLVERGPRNTVRP